MAPATLLLLALGAAAAPAPDRISAPLAEALSRERGATLAVWVYFSDKGAPGESPMAAVTPRAASRRRLRADPGPEDDFEERILPRRYVDAVAGRVVRVRHELRWFNAVSVDASSEQVASLAALPCVARLDLVRRFRRGAPEPFSPLPAESAPAASAATASGLDYGSSLGQLEQIHVPEVHALGLHGEGIVIAVFDAGFNNLAHEAFASLHVVAQHDFVNGDDDVGDGNDQGNGSHGTETLSVLAGFKPGQLIGPAYAASFLLAKTENTDSETPVEEDNWAAAAQWAEAMGVDLISSSLGYLTFDAPYHSYTYADMDGSTAASTRAAAAAAARGVVVVNSAGNEGANAEHNTLSAPADGRRVVAVGAVDASGRRTDFSSVGPTADKRRKPDVAAQGQFVKAASPLLRHGYGSVDGTSFSCPLTAGVVALVLQAHPAYTVNQVRSVLHSTASQAAHPDNLLGWGIVDALGAVNAPAPPR